MVVSQIVVFLSVFQGQSGVKTVPFFASAFTRNLFVFKGTNQNPRRGNLLGPITSRNPTPVYDISKPLNNMIQNRDIGPAVRVFTNGPGDLGSIPGRVIPKTLKMELDTTLLNTQHYKVRFKGKVEQSWEWSSTLPYTLV